MSDKEFYILLRCMQVIMRVNRHQNRFEQKKKKKKKTQKIKTKNKNPGETEILNEKKKHVYLHS